MKLHFAENLKSKRLELGWSQERAAMELSIKCGKRIDKNNYQAWEKGRSFPITPEKLIAIAEVFQVDDLYLFITKPCSAIGLNSLA